MGHVEFGWGDNSKQDTSKTDFEMRTSWQAAEASEHFRRLFNVNLLSFVGRVVKLFSPPQSVGLLFEFGPGMRDKFARLVDEQAFPPKTLREAFIPRIARSPVTPDNPGRSHKDAYWRSLAAGAAIGASFRERGTGTSLHIAFNANQCDVHVDRNGFVTETGGHVHWDLNGLLRHLTMDLAADKAPWLVGSMTYIGKNNRPVFQATLSPWLTVDLPSKDGNNRTGVTAGVQIVGKFR